MLRQGHVTSVGSASAMLTAEVKLNNSNIMKQKDAHRIYIVRSSYTPDVNTLLSDSGVSLIDHHEKRHKPNNVR